MKSKIFFVFVIACCSFPCMASDMLPSGGYYETQSVNCDINSMRAELDRATAGRRAVITVVQCAPRADVVDSGYEMDYVAAPIERVIDRRVYVEETVQQYRPVVHYVPAGTYSRVRRACNKCDM